MSETERNAARYSWLRERIEVRKLESMAGDSRTALTFRIGCAFLDSRGRPHENGADVDSAIDKAMAEQWGSL